MRIVDTINTVYKNKNIGGFQNTLLSNGMEKLSA